MRSTLYTLDDVDLSTLNDYPIPVAEWDHASIQMVPLTAAASTGVVEVKKSITGERADAVSFSAAVNPSLTTRAISESIDITDIAYLHVQVTTAESGIRYRAALILTNWNG